MAINVIFMTFWSLAIVILLALWRKRLSRGSKHIWVVVLGDIGRSPRMQYHTLSLASRGFKVTIIGYGGSKPLNSVTIFRNVSIKHMREFPKIFGRFPRLLVYLLKTIWQTITFFVTFLLLPRPERILIQNPPTIPTLFCTVIWAKFVNCKIILDWHNYGYSILALGVSKKSLLVKFAHWFEGFFGSFANSHICVTKALKADLKSQWNIEATVLYDRPPMIFKPCSALEKHKLFTKLSAQYSVFGTEDRSIFTELIDEKTAIERENRPALLISSTSWTEDEDFGLLLKAIEKYDVAASAEKKLPKLVCVITGKGPQKDYYRGIIAETNYSNIQFCLPWLSAEDYPKLLGSADLGVCLHTSSSGLDLPMKVVDMFGCELPVLAYDFSCLDELVRDGRNGLVFRTSDELFDRLVDVFTNFPINRRLKDLKNGLKEYSTIRWEDEWSSKVEHLFL